MSETGEGPSKRVEPEFASRVSGALGERLSSTAGVARFLHATDRENAQKILNGGLLIDKRMGFAGVAVPLGRDISGSLRQVRFTHLNLPVVIFVAFPNVRPVVMERIGQDLLPADFRHETLFISAEVPQESLTNYDRTDAYFDTRFIEGFYDKSANEWIANPQYWENVLRQEKVRNNWTDEQYQAKREEALQKYRQEALARLDQASREYQALKEEPQEKWWLKQTDPEDQETA